MTFAFQIKNKYKVSATEGPSTGHHNEAQITQSQAIDSFMFFILKNKDAPSEMAADTASYIAEQKISDETARAYSRAVSEYARMIQPKGKELPEDEDQDAAEKTETAAQTKKRGK